MITMNIKDNIVNYINDNTSIISIYDDNVYIYKYSKLESFNDKEVIVSCDIKDIYISGYNLKITKMTSSELLIEGNVLNIKFGEYNGWDYI